MDGECTNRRHGVVQVYSTLCESSTLLLPLHGQVQYFTFIMYPSKENNVVLHFI